MAEGVGIKPSDVRDHEDLGEVNGDLAAGQQLDQRAGPFRIE